MLDSYKDVRMFVLAMFLDTHQYLCGNVDSPRQVLTFRTKDVCRHWYIT
jgi:hypothetical protein